MNVDRNKSGEPELSIQGFLPKIARGLVDLIYPPVCAMCQQGLAAECQEAICADCITKFRHSVREACPRCATPLVSSSWIKDECPTCRQSQFAFAGAVNWGEYKGLLREAVLRMKHSHGEPLAAPLMRLFYAERHEAIHSWQVDAVVPVPLHWTRRLWRGYNQAGALARELARMLGKPFRASWIWRAKQTPAQTSVTAAARRRNLRQALRAKLPERWKGRRILLVDDVMTTGSTADACARALLAAGAGTVYAAVLARATSETATGGSSSAI